MLRLNLICNGMMIFNEISGSELEIIIPDIEGHKRGLCTAESPAQSLVSDLPIGSYSLSGVLPTSGSLRKVIDPLSYLVLRKGVVKINRKRAVAISAIIRVPKPKLIRLFRASEPMINVFGKTPSKLVAFEIPKIHNDVVVLSYTDISPKTRLILQRGVGAPAATALTGAEGIINWLIYSTERPAANLSNQPHPTGLNTIIEFNGKPTDFALSQIGNKDFPYRTGIGMESIHMAAIHELPKTPGAKRPIITSGPFGCSGAVIGRP